MSDDACPCGSGNSFAVCCEPVLGGAPAIHAEALMRARYCAYTRGDMAFLVSTMTAEAQAAFDPVEAAGIAARAVWEKLEIRAATEDNEAAHVEYIAHFKLDGQRRIHHERAHFCKVGDRWTVCGGETNPKEPPRQSEKVGRNDPCPCGSGKKYKKCCGL